MGYRSDAMEILERCVAGLDVHKAMVMACVRQVDENGELRECVREFGTSTRQLLQLADWLREMKVTQAAMESTGVYWKPIWHVLDGQVRLLLVNAQHIKHVPGRKTDVKDCQWIAQLLQHGLLKGSFVPEAPQQELRDLTRLRTQMMARKAQTANRIQKVLEDANIKLASVATDVLGVSGREMIGAMIQGERNQQVLAGMARGLLKRKTSQLEEALEGRVSEHHQFVLRVLMEELAATEKAVREIEHRLEEKMLPFARQLELLRSIPGVGQDIARVIVAEVGTEMSQYPDAGHLCSWAGVCPGNHQSAGKRKTGKTRRGNRWLRGALVQAGWAASRKKDSYLSGLYARLVGRRGKKRALVACANSILGSVYHMLSRNEPYKDLGVNHHSKTEGHRLTRNLVKRLEAQGFIVALTKQAA